MGSKSIFFFIEFLTLLSALRHYAISLAFDTDYVGSSSQLLGSFPARGGNALTRNSAIFDELWFFIKDMSEIRLAVVNLPISGNHTVNRLTDVCTS